MPRTLNVAVLLIALLAGCATSHQGRPAEAPPPAVTATYAVTRDVIVTPPDWPGGALRADVYRPEMPGSLPAVLLLHGGAWKRGDRAQVEGLAKRIAARGYVVVNSTYRLVPQWIFPAQLRDAQQAVLWMRSEASARFGIDANRIGGFGYSAGAHLVALVAAVADDPVLGMPGTRMKAVVAGGCPCDLTQYAGGTLVPAFIGGPRSEKLDTYRAASPASHVRPGQPPVFQYHGTLDDYVPFEQATSYRAKLDAACVPNELFVLHGHGHITAFFADGEAVQRAIDFLDRHLR